MKKLKTAVSVLSVLGLGAWAAISAPKNYSLTKDTDEKVYMVSVKGDIVNDNAAAVKNRKEVVNELNYKLAGKGYTITHTYDTVYNGFAIKTTANIADIVKSLQGVRSVEEEHTYSRPEVVDPSDPVSTGTVLGDQLQNYSAQSMKATAAHVNAVIAANGGTGTSQGGKGVLIGIADTGLYLNQVEGTDARTTAEKTAAEHKKGGEADPITLNAPAFQPLTDTSADVFTQAKLDAVKGSLTTGKTAVRINSKIAYAYDYADGDNNVDPSKGTADNVHGTHVASLASANGTAFQGIAPNAQLAIFKVFPDNSSGASDSSIEAALEDATKLGVDTLNFSLGTDLTESGDTTSDATNMAIKAAKDKGIIVNFSAGNAGKSSFSGTKGYGDWTTDTVETGVLGGNALTDEYANIVASSNNDNAYYSSIMMVKSSTTGAADTPVAYDDQVTNKTGSSLHYTTEHKLADLLGGEASKTLNYVYVGGLGADTDYAGKDVTGKVAVVNRGDLTFWNKVVYAQNAGASALIIVNNAASTTFNFSFDFNDHNPDIPVVLVFKSMGDVFKNNADATTYAGTMTLSQNTVQKASDGHTVSSFSSDGSSANLDIDPTIAAPGHNIIGAIDASATGAASSLYGYDNYDGTSMACPNLTGSIALALGEKNPDNAGVLTAGSDSAYQLYKQHVSMMAMSTASQLVDGSGNTASPRMQGAGEIDVKNLLMADSYVTTEDDGTDGFLDEGTDVAKAELKNNGTLKQDLSDATKKAYIDISYTIHNDSSSIHTYKPTIDVLIPQLEVQETQAQYDKEASDPSLTKDIPANLPSSITMSTNDDVVIKGADAGDEISVNPLSTATGTVHYEIDNLAFKKAFNDTNNPDFDGTLREYFNKYFANAGGSYVEGYVHFTDTTNDSTTANDANLSLTYMGFYGDYTKGAAVEDFDFEKTSGHLYNSEMIDSYMKNLSNTEYVKKNAYTGSTLSGVATTPSDTTIGKIATMDGSALAGSSSAFKSVTATGDTTHRIYSGSSTSNKLVAVLFVNRTLSKATWSVKQGSTVKKSGDIEDLFSYSGTAYHQDNSGALEKSWLTVDSAYQIRHGYASIDLSSLAEGDNYTLNFSFTLQGTGTTQTKSYPLTVDKSAPTLKSAEIVTDGTTKKLHIVSDGANNIISLGGVNFVPTAVSGSTGAYETTIKLKDTQFNAEQLVSFTDYAQNTTNLLLNLNDLTFIASSPLLTSKMDFTVDYHKKSKGVYYFYLNLTDASGNAVTLKSNYTVYFNIGAGLTNDDIAVTVDGSDVTFVYDSTTGMIAISVPGDATEGSELGINVKPTNFTEPSTSTSTSASTVTSVSTATSTSTSTSTTNNGGGCFHKSGAVDPITLTDSFLAVTGLAALAYFFVVKKRRF